VSPAGLAGRRVVVTAGGTRESIDPVRFIGNRSSGRMGAALALAAREAGADVSLISTVPGPAGIALVAVESAQEMRDAVWSALDSADVLFMAAAVADYRPRDAAARKLKKSDAGLTLELVPTVDVLTDLRRHPRHEEALIVGFAAETDDLEANAQSKLERKGLDLIVLNDIAAPGIGMGTEDNAVTVFDAAGEVLAVERMPKIDVARRLIDLVAARLSPPG
jgi:phosphopantothenoylcysteine decarboxylase/phosphopantothenate--cysteine ligase